MVSVDEILQMLRTRTKAIFIFFFVFPTIIWNSRIIFWLIFEILPTFIFEIYRLFFEFPILFFEFPILIFEFQALFFEFPIFFLEFQRLILLMF